MTEFEKTVQDMRTAQKAWYRYHDQLDLTRAKALERKVDAALEKKAALDQVPDLFGGAETAETQTDTDGHGQTRTDAETAETQTDTDEHRQTQTDAETDGPAWVPGGGME